MVLVGRGEMIPGDPESKGIHTHLPGRNYSIHLHFSRFRKDLKWLTDVTTVPPEELEGNNGGNTRGGQLTLLSRESLEIPASPAHSPVGFWESRQESVVSGRLRVQGSDTGIGGQDHPQCPCFLASLSGGLQRWALNEPFHF